MKFSKLMLKMSDGYNEYVQDYKKYISTEESIFDAEEEIEVWDGYNPPPVITEAEYEKQRRRHSKLKKKAKILVSKAKKILLGNKSKLTTKDKKRLKRFKCRLHNPLF